jgi:acetate---CoA ligase (ADP-forming)
VSGTPDSAMRALARAVRPRSVAIVGASEDPLKYGSRLARSTIECAFPGDLHLVNPRPGAFMGHSFIPSLREIDRDGGGDDYDASSPDLVVVAVPAARCPEVVAQAAELGCGCAVVVATGFREVGAHALERELAAAAAGSQLRIIGPNCLGLYAAAGQINASGDASIPPGRIAVVAQSGIIGLSICHRAKRHRLGISHLFSIGNQVDLEFADCCELLAADDTAETVLLYAEEFREEPRFLDALARLAERKPVAVLRGGRTEAGAAAAAAHTGSRAGDSEMLSQALAQAGAIEVSSDGELLLAALAFAGSSAAIPLRSRRISLVSDSGGFAVSGADAAIELGLELRSHSPEVIAALEEVLLERACKRNPIDMIGGPELRADVFESVVRACLSSGEIDGAVLVGGYGGYEHVGGDTLLQREVRAAAELVKVRDELGKPLVVASLYEGEEHAGIRYLREHGVPVVGDIQDALRIMALKALREERLVGSSHSR